MYTRKFVQKLFLFCLFLSGQALLFSGEAYAYKNCCGCGSLSWCQYSTYCHCPGKEHCPWCAAPIQPPDLKTFQSIPPGEKYGADVDIKSVPVSMLTSYTEKVLSDIRQKNGREVMGMELVANIGKDMKFGCSAIDDNYFQHNITFALKDK